MISVQRFRVRISDRSHPHYDETGVVEIRDGVAETIMGDMVKIELDCCPMLIESCYASPLQYGLIGEAEDDHDR